ncbi:MAG TPA: hypothetical protein VNU24_06850, partial [Solirubrobacteraceae bacterium]|nr:hypothetical protein [Solirubrobacteraceae bacterium]
MSDAPGGASEPGQLEPALEDQQVSADHDPVSVTEIETEQGGELSGEEAHAGEPFAATAPDEQPHSDGAATEPGSIASALDMEGLPASDPQVVRTVEALLFLAPDPLSPQELADASETEELGVIAALAELGE